MNFATFFPRLKAQGNILVLKFKRQQSAATQPDLEVELTQALSDNTGTRSKETPSDRMQAAQAGRRRRERRREERSGHGDIRVKIDETFLTSN